MKHLKLFEELNTDQEHIMLSAIKKAYETQDLKIIQYIKNKGFDLKKCEKEIAIYLFENLYLDELVLLNSKYEEIVDYIKNNLYDLNVFKHPQNDGLALGSKRNDIIIEMNDKYKPMALFIDNNIEMKIRNYAKMFTFYGHIEGVLYTLLDVRTKGEDNINANKWISLFEKFMRNLMMKQYNIRVDGLVSTRTKFDQWDLSDSWKRIDESYSSNMIDNFYDFYGKIVLVTKFMIWGNDYKIFYMDESGKTHTYDGTMKDIYEDFLDTDQTFTVEYEKKPQPIIQPKRIPKKIPKKTKGSNRYNLVYYVGNIKKQTLEWNLNNQLANGLRKKYQSEILFPQYQLGKIRKELVK